LEVLAIVDDAFEKTDAVRVSGARSSVNLPPGPGRPISHASEMQE
jgi:hypothetical protein